MKENVTKLIKIITNGDNETEKNKRKEKIKKSKSRETKLWKKNITTNNNNNKLNAIQGCKKVFSF